MNKFSHPQDASCLQVHNTLEAYLADELDANTHAKIEAHIAFCPTCRDEVHFAKTIGKTLQELPRPEPPQAVFDAVEAYVRAHPGKREKWWHRLFRLSTPSNNPILSLVRSGALVCLFGIAAFSIHQYQQHQEIVQASMDLDYAISKLNYAVERTGIVVREKLPNVQIDEASRRRLLKLKKPQAGS